MSEPIVLSPVPSPVHRSLIAAARERPDRHLQPPERVRGRARRLLADKLVGLGLAERVVVDGGETAWWLEPDRGSIGLRLPRYDHDEAEVTADADAVTGPEGGGASRSEVERTGGAILALRPSEPRGWTKIARVLALLRRPEGADLQALAAATGWLPHTARAALTGLRRKGHAIEAHKADDAGGRTVYHIAPVTEAGDEGAQ